MEANLDDYFWMIDRLGMEDNQKNKVDNEKNTVVLDKMLTGSIANGYYMAKLIVEMHSTYLKRTRKKFTLDPAISTVKDNLQKKTRKVRGEANPKVGTKWSSPFPSCKLLFFHPIDASCFE